ncbi:Lpp/OprI family alanine-zipper lipoprotein [Vibrio sp. ZSDZ34]|jgi:murein lipoprotein|uniref:Major outer membrane lipoprotein Lpp n=1 Tax=Vibrio gelatinilyticus TaxID=2893468 RepID=A0A9X1W9K9_9VIBR|nr:Lpp/OprI family alanine-zipper lipoprotein [Vibrio gelatinilyticus]MCJ2376174.1 Lpp/OprI family alanine-zipper lipoprotein [Vibrio gelatinilyticus]
MNKVLIAAAASSVFLLAGCASGPDEETQSQMTDLNNQVSQLSDEVAALKSQVDSSSMEANKNAMEAKEEAARANERIDNIAQSYTK